MKHPLQQGIVFLVLVLFSALANAQHLQLRGMVTDSSGNKLEGATVRLFKDDMLIRQQRMGTNGFVFSRLNTCNYTVKASFFLRRVYLHAFKEGHSPHVFISGKTALRRMKIDRAE